MKTNNSRSIGDAINLALDILATNNISRLEGFGIVIDWLTFLDTYQLSENNKINKLITFAKITATEPR